MPRFRKKGPDPVDVYVGKQIRRFRLTKNISQSVIAETLGLTFQQVQKYEKGVNRIAPGRLVKIAELLGVGIVDFFPTPSTNNAKLPDDPIYQLGQIRDGIRLARAFLDSDDSARDAILTVAQRFAETGHQ